jgi:predicted RNase H-like nuclease
VFPAPGRAVLAAESYEDACAISRAESGKAISKQLFNIVPKIREADDVLGAFTAPPQRRDQLFEMCPELSFAVLGGAPMRANKRTAAGRAERLTALRSARDVLGELGDLGEFGDMAGPVTGAPAGAAPDDLLDAIVGAWTAWRYLMGTHTQLGDERDERGLPMRVVA